MASLSRPQCRRLLLLLQSLAEAELSLSPIRRGLAEAAPAELEALFFSLSPSFSPSPSPSCPSLSPSPSLPSPSLPYSPPSPPPSSVGPLSLRQFLLAHAAQIDAESCCAALRRFDVQEKGYWTLHDFLSIAADVPRGGSAWRAQRGGGHRLSAGFARPIALLVRLCEAEAEVQRRLEPMRRTLRDEHGVTAEEAFVMLAGARIGGSGRREPAESPDYDESASSYSADEDRSCHLATGTRPARVLHVPVAVSLARLENSFREKWLPLGDEQLDALAARLHADADGWISFEAFARAISPGCFDAYVEMASAAPEAGALDAGPHGRSPLGCPASPASARTRSPLPIWRGPAGLVGSSPALSRPARRHSGSPTSASPSSLGRWCGSMRASADRPWVGPFDGQSACAHLGSPGRRERPSTPLPRHMLFDDEDALGWRLPTTDCADHIDSHCTACPASPCGAWSADAHAGLDASQCSGFKSPLGMGPSSYRGTRTGPTPVRQPEPLAGNRAASAHGRDRAPAARHSPLNTQSSPQLYRHNVSFCEANPAGVHGANSGHAWLEQCAPSACLPHRPSSHKPFPTNLSSPRLVMPQTRLATGPCDMDGVNGRVESAVGEVAARQSGLQMIHQLVGAAQVLLERLTHEEGSPLATR